MEILFHKLGIDWKLLLSQGVNFLILLGVLTFFVYRPLLRLLQDRRSTIEEGMRGADEAARRLREIETEREERLKEAERKAFDIVSRAEGRGKEEQAALIAKGEERAQAVLEEARIVAEQKKAEGERKPHAEAVSFIRSVLAKTVDLDPNRVDEALVRQAVDLVRNEKRI